MKHLINLTIILSLLAQICLAQQAEKVKENKKVQIENVKEYKVVYDNIAALVKQAKRDSISYVGMTFSEFAKQLDKRGLKIMQTWITGYDSGKLYPQHVYAIMVRFTSDEAENYARANDLWTPYIIVNFAASKPFEKALSLIKQYKGYYNEEVAAFYADAVVQSLYFNCPDDIYLLKYRRATEK